MAWFELGCPLLQLVKHGHWFSDMNTALLGIVKGWWPAPSGGHSRCDFLISGTPRVSLPTYPLCVLGEMLFALPIVSLGDYNSVVRHWYFSIPPS